MQPLTLEILVHIASVQILKAPGTRAMFWKFNHAVQQFMNAASNNLIHSIDTVDTTNCRYLNGMGLIRASYVLYLLKNWTFSQLLVRMDEFVSFFRLFYHNFPACCWLHGF
jgi:hypothetical protein